MGHYKSASSKKIKKCLGKKTLDYNMYEKSRLVDFLYVLMIYQHNEPFKTFRVFNYYNMLSLTSCKGRLFDPWNSCFLETSTALNVCNQALIIIF